MPNVSVIIPVYGVEDYIERCARSLFEQTLGDIEYIYVNDCTPDNSIQILESVIKDYPHRKNQVRIIEMDKNSGQAAVRKRGIEAATGDYIIHCDSDDFVDRGMYECMYEIAISGDFDIVSCDFYRGKETQWNYCSSKFNSKSDLVEDILYMPFGGALWNKLVKNSIVKDSSVVYPEMNITEDLALTIQYSIISNSFGYINKALYYYCIRDNSSVKSFSYENVIAGTRQHCANLDIAIKAIEEHAEPEKYSKAILHHKLGTKNNFLQIMHGRDIVKMWRNTYKEINYKIIFSDVVSFKEKMNFIITYLGLYPAYNKLFKH